MGNGRPNGAFARGILPYLPENADGASTQYSIDLQTNSRINMNRDANNNNEQNGYGNMFGGTGFTPGPTGFTPGPSGFTPGPSGFTPGPAGLSPGRTGMTPTNWNDMNMSENPESWVCGDWRASG